MGWLRRWRAKRTWQREVNAAWKPSYDALARYNSETSRGVAHDERFRKSMEAVQRDYDENYVPLLRRMP